MAKTTVLRLADLPTRKVTQINYVPDAEAMKLLATEMGVNAVRKMRLEGTVQPLGNKDWQLQARLGVTVVQPCVVTLEPVTTRIEESIFRQYLSGWKAPTSAEAEMDGDDTSEPLPDSLDLAEIAAEVLAISVPRYPRVEGATLGQADFTEPGQEPMTDEDVKPFAGLASLKAKLENPNKN